LDCPNGNPLLRRDKSQFNQTPQPTFEVPALGPLKLSRAVIDPAAFGTTPKNPPPTGMTIRTDESIPNCGFSSSRRVRRAALHPHNHEQISNLPSEEHNFLPLEYQPTKLARRQRRQSPRNSPGYPIWGHRTRTLTISADLAGSISRRPSLAKRFPRGTP
jgi:hypothetical protein